MPIALMAKTAIREAAIAMLLGAVAAKRLTARIEISADVPTPQADLPAVIVRNGTEHKQSQAKQNANFRTTVTLFVEGRVQATSLKLAQAKLDTLGAALEDALFRDTGEPTSLFRLIEEVAQVTTTYELSSDGAVHFGQMKMLIDLVTMEVFEPQPQPAFTRVHVKVDLAGPFDRTGDYPAPTEPVYPVAPAPRESGPDGRLEAEIDVTLPQP